MTDTTTAPAPAVPPAVFTTTTLRKAADLAADAYRPLWTGPSGEESSGEAVALHLEASITLLDRDGWVRVYDYSRTRSAGVIADDDSMTVEDMLKSLLRLVRDELDDNNGRRTMPAALRHVAEGGVHGDTDTADIASGVLDLVVRAHTGSGSARATPWSERLNRTHADVTALLRAGASFARAYGPGAPGDQEHAA